MEQFIAERTGSKIFCDSIGTYGEVETELQKHDNAQLRSLKLFDKSFGKIGSSIAIYNDVVLVLNLE